VAKPPCAKGAKRSGTFRALPAFRFERFPLDPCIEGLEDSKRLAADVLVRSLKQVFRETQCAPQAAEYSLFGSDSPIGAMAGLFAITFRWP